MLLPPACEMSSALGDIVELDLALAFSVQRCFCVQPFPSASVYELTKLVHAKLDDVNGAIELV